MPTVSASYRPVILLEAVFLIFFYLSQVTTMSHKMIPFHIHIKTLHLIFRP